MRPPALGFPDPGKSFELFPYAKDDPADCEQPQLQSQVLNQNIVQKFVSYLKHYILNFTLVDGQSPLLAKW